MEVNAEKYEEFSNYPFDDDKAYQEGLSEIIALQKQTGTQLTEKQLEDVVGRTKAYYYSSAFGIPISWDEYEKHRQNHAKVKPESGGEDATTSDPVPKNLTFAEIKDLIESGQTHLIPNCGDIPGGVNTDPPSNCQADSRRKPWEMESVNRIETEML